MAGNDILIPLVGMYENTSQRSGKQYFIGYLGKAKLVMFQNTEAKEGEPGWTVFVSQRPDKRGDLTASSSQSQKPATRAGSSSVDVGVPILGASDRRY